MSALAAKKPNCGFGRLIDLARAEPVAVAKHGRPVIVVMAVEEFELVTALQVSGDKSPAVTKAPKNSIYRDD